MKWFSVSGIQKEIKKIRWPNKKEMAKDTTTALVFMFLFGVFFVASDFVIAALLKILGIGA